MRKLTHQLLRGASLLALAILPLLSGCASNMSNMWRDEAFQSGTLKNVLVVALRPDPARRRLWEDSFVSGLTARGTKATASYRLYADAPPDTQQVEDAVRRDGYDGVLVSMRLPDGVEHAFVHGYTRREAVTKKNPFTGAYYTVWEEVHVPERTEVIKVANFKTDVWTTADGGSLVWSGTSRTTNGVDANLIRHKVEKMVLPELTKAGIVAAKSKM